MEKITSKKYSLKSDDRFKTIKLKFNRLTAIIWEKLMLTTDKDFFKKTLSRRQGECKGLGCCCPSICKYLDENGKCKIYNQKDEKGNFKCNFVFPKHYNDWKRTIIDGECGYWWEKNGKECKPWPNR